MSKGAAITIALFAALCGVIMVLHGSRADPAEAWPSYALGLFCLTIVGANLLPGRAGQFCGSVVGLCIVIAGLAYVGEQLRASPLVVPKRNEPSLLKACVFLLVFGVPAALYVFHVRFGLSTSAPPPLQQAHEADDKAQH